MASAFPVLYQDTGKYLTCGELWHHPTYSETWDRSFSDEMGQLFSGVVTGPDGKGNRLEGTSTFLPYTLRTSPKNASMKCATHPSYVQNIQSRAIQIAPASPFMAPMFAIQGILVRKMSTWNSSSWSLTAGYHTKGGLFAFVDISNFYLDTPMKKPEYVKIQFSKIPQKFVDE